MANCIPQLNRILEPSFWSELGEGSCEAIQKLIDKISSFVESIWKTVSEWFSETERSDLVEQQVLPPYVFPLENLSIRALQVDDELLKTISCLYALEAIEEKKLSRRPITLNTLREIIDKANREELGEGEPEIKLERFLKRFNQYNHQPVIDLGLEDEIGELDRLLNEREEICFLTQGGLNTTIYADRSNERYLVFCPHLPTGVGLHTFRSPREAAEFIIGNKENYQMQLVPFQKREPLNG